MLRHFILAIFLLTLALPATAMAAPAARSVSEDCHGTPAKHDDKQSPDLRQHGCIGCIAPLTATMRIAAVDPLAFVPFAEPVRRLTGTTPRPSLPPPRD